ncbi:hypothetical protein BBJ28_00024943 [Nothophytophthora sp. Chile5]|nr:hypothetical protein BBJ28_00024943 [Nothophytophthora sp. Chile5]
MTGKIARQLGGNGEDPLTRDDHARAEALENVVAALADKPTDAITDVASRQLLQTDDIGAGDLFARQQKAKQDQLDALVDGLAPRQFLQADDGGTTDVFAREQTARQDELDALIDGLAGSPATAMNLAALEGFLASDAAKEAKVEQLVNFLADSPAVPAVRSGKLLTSTESDGPDIFANEQAKKEKELEDLVSGLANDTTTLLADDADSVANVNASAAFPKVAFGGAFLLLAVVLLNVVLKRPGTSRKTQETKETERDFGYVVLHE